MTRRPPPLKRRLLQSQILTAAADLFRARGYRATTLEEIAQHVEMFKATLYRDLPPHHDAPRAGVEEDPGERLSTR